MAAVPQSLVARLEAVADKLERFQVSLEEGGASVAVARRPAASSARASAGSGGGAPPAPSGGSIAAYDNLLQAHLQPVIQHGQAIGGEVQQVTQHLAKAFQAQRDVLIIASLAKQPDTSGLQEVLQPVAQEMMNAGVMADNRRSTVFQQLKAVTEALQACGWLAYAGPGSGMPMPAQHINDAWSSAEFYANKLLMQYRGVDETQVEWVKGIKDLVQGLQAFVRSNYPQGIKWNSSGVSLQEAKAAAAAGGAGGKAPAAAAPAASAAPAAAPAGGRGPPPPPPPGALLQERPAKGGAAAAGGGAGGGGPSRGDLLAALQKGDGVTSGLRKVTDDMKTKNRPDRGGKVDSPGPKPAAAPAAASAAGPAAGKPRIELEQERKWVVEHQVGNQAIVIDQTTSKQTVYIYNCSQCVVQVKGKVNTISLDKCKQTGLVFEDVIATCEVVNCNSVQVQCLGYIPTVSIDKTDGCQLFVPQALSKNPDFQVVSAKSSEMNVVVVAADPEKEDAVEHAVPEQFISSFRGGRLVTVAASHSGG